MRLKKWIAALCSFALLVIPSVSFAEVGVRAAEISENEVTEIDFGENYSSFEEDWYSLGGDWKLEGDVLKQTKSSQGAFNMQLNYRKKLYGDFTAKLRFRLVEENGAEGWFAFFFRRTQITDNHELSGFGICTEGPKSNPPGKTYMINWSKSLAYSDYMDEVNIDGFVEAVVVAAGNKFSFYFNENIKTGEANIVIEDDSFPEAGFVGIGAGSSRIEIDYLNLYTGAAQQGILGGGSSSGVVEIDRSIVLPKAKKIDATAWSCAAVSLVCIGALAFVLVKNGRGKKNEK